MEDRVTLTDDRATARRPVRDALLISLLFAVFVAGGDLLVPRGGYVFGLLLAGGILTIAFAVKHVMRRLLAVAAFLVLAAAVAVGAPLIRSRFEAAPPEQPAATGASYTDSIAITQVWLARWENISFGLRVVADVVTARTPCPEPHRAFGDRVVTHERVVTGYTYFGMVLDRAVVGCDGETVTEAR